VIKSYDIGKYCGTDREKYIQVMGKFLKFLSNNGIIINFVFTTLKFEYLKNGVKKYGFGRDPIKKIKPMNFLDTLSSYYPYIAVWTTAKSARLRRTTVLLDSFTGEITNCWGELQTHHEIKIIPKGDICNPFISSSDIVTKYVDEYLFHNRLYLKEENIQSAFENCGVTNFHIYYVGHGNLPEIVPIIERKIECHNFYKRPMIYILKEDLIKKESDLIENSEIFTKIIKFACDKQSGFKFFSSDEDTKIGQIHKGDYFLYFGAKGKQIADYFVALGYGIIPVNISGFPEQKDLENYE